MQFYILFIKTWYTLIYCAIIAFFLCFVFIFYILRHSWASMMLEANSEIGIISQSLGHMSLRTTEIYLGRISVSKIDRASDNMLNNLVRGSSSRQRSKNKVMALRDNPPIQIKETIGKKCKKLISSIASKLFSFI